MRLRFLKRILNSLKDLTKDEMDAIRQLIFFPDGHVRYDWKYPGAIVF